MKMNVYTPQAMDQTPQARGIVAGTRVATTIGWRAVEDVKPGEKVLTFDGGLQDVVRVDRTKLWSKAKGCPRAMWPLTVPVGALGNQAEMQLLPDQPVMLESDAAEDIFGDPFTLMEAAALEGFRGISRDFPTDDVDVVTLYFESEQVIFANIGALFLCPQDVSDHAGPTDADRIVYDLLPFDSATDLTRLIAREDKELAQGATY